MPPSETARPRALAWRGAVRSRGTSGNAGILASGARSTTAIGSRTGNARSAAPSAAAAKPGVIRSAAVRFDRRWSNTLERR